MTPSKRKYKRPETWGAIRKLPSGRHQASYVHLGIRYNAPHTFDGVQDARAYLAAVRTDIQRGKWSSPTAARAQTFKAYANKWVAERTNARGASLRPKTRIEYERQLDKGLSTFADHPLQDISAASVRGWHSERIKAGKTAAATEARLLRAILNTAIEDGLVASNPVPAKFTKSSAGHAYRPPTVDELDALLRHVNDRFQAAILIAAYGGLRLSEWRALRRRDLQLVDDHYVVTVTRQAQYVSGEGWITGPPKSQSGIRQQHLPTWITPDIEAHLKALVGPFPDSLIFAPRGSSEYVHDNEFNKTWNLARKAVGVVGIVREHDLRRFSGSHLIHTAKASLIEARDFLGHSSTVVTEKHYEYKVSDRAAELAEAMPRLKTVTKLRLAR